MKNNILITMGILILVGLAFQGIFGVAAGIMVASIIGIVYGIIKKNKQFVGWCSAALIIDLICIILFFLGVIRAIG